MFRVVRAHGHDDAAATRPFETEADILEGPSLAGALVVDGQAAVLQSKFAQVVAVQSGFADAVDPGQ